MRVVSRWCRCVVQRLCATDCKRPCLVRAAAPHSARHGRRACMPKGFMQGCIQVVEHGRCRTHRQQTTTIAETQSPQSVLIGIENLLYFYKYRLFLQTEAGSKVPACKPHSTQKRKTASLQPLLRYAVSHDGKKSKNVR